MTDNHNNHNNLTESKKNNEHDFELLQNEFNTFLEQQTVTFATTNEKQSSTHSCDHTDQFIESIQDNLDALMPQYTIPSTHTSAFHKHDESLNTAQPIDQALLDTAPTQQERLPRHLETPAIELPATPSPSNQTSHKKFISRTLIAASFAAAAIVWFFWPIEQEPLSQTAQQLQNHSTKQSLPAAIQSKTTADNSTPVLTTNEPVHITANLNVSLQKSPQRVIVNAKIVQATATADNTLNVAVRIGNIRSAPSRSGKVLYKLVRGTQVTKLSVQGEWFQVRLQNGAVAWAHYSIF
ncbi:SH3 domain-containing protein [Mariprofundus ferrooxydans]|nr:SH3 domain-containing protein [Mariprofundus ferrooxydans]